MTSPIVLCGLGRTGARVLTYLRAGEEDEGRLVAELSVTAADGLHGRTIAEAIESQGATCLAHLPAAGAEQLPGRIDPGARLQPGDYVALCGRPRDLAPLLGVEG